MKSGSIKKGIRLIFVLHRSWLENMSWAKPGKEVSIAIKLLNKGTSAGKKIRANLSAINGSTTVVQSESEFGSIAPNEMAASQKSFTFRVNEDSVEVEKFKLTIRDENKTEWVEFFELPIKKDLPQIKNFEIADGRVFTVAKGGTDIETVITRCRKWRWRSKSR